MAAGIELFSPVPGETQREDAALLELGVAADVQELLPEFLLVDGEQILPKHPRLSILFHLPALILSCVRWRPLELQPHAPGAMKGSMWAAEQEASHSQGEEIN